MKLTKLLLIVLILFPIMGCATIINGTKQKISFSSDPSGATVTIKKLIGNDPDITVKTPTIVSLSRSHRYSALFEKEGYVEQHKKITREKTVKSVGKSMLMGTTGYLVDSYTGATYELVPSEVHAVLEQKRKNADIKKAISMEEMGSNEQ